MLFKRRPLILLCIMLTGVYNNTALSREFNVPADHRTIQQAIDASGSGDSIRVAVGTYTENLNIRSGMQIIGEETAKTILRQPVGNTSSVSINAGTDITLRNLTFTSSSGGLGNIINITGASSNITISNNVFNADNSATAIQIADTSSVSINNNVFAGNGTAISSAAIQTTIQNNIFSGNQTNVSPANSSASIHHNCFASGDTPVGTNTKTGNLAFVDAAQQDYHLRAESTCIDAGTGQDSFDNTTADAGAYGGTLSDLRPFAIQSLNAEDISVNNTAPYNLRLTWAANTAYNINHYRIHYDTDTDGEPYQGTGAHDNNGNPQASPIDTTTTTATYTLYNLTLPSLTMNAPVLSLDSAGNQSITLHWTAVSGANGYRINYGTNNTRENYIDVDSKITHYTLTGLTNATTYQVSVAAGKQATYYFAIAAVDNSAAQNVSSIITGKSTQTLTLGAQQYGAESNPITATPEPVQYFPILPSGKSDKRCFIATAAYGHYSAPQVQMLRNFRDRYLLPHAAGRAFVNWYYANSPAIANIIQKSEILKAIVRILLLPAMLLAWFLTQASWLQQATISLSLLALVILGTKKLRHYPSAIPFAANNTQKAY